MADHPVPATEQSCYIPGLSRPVRCVTLRVPLDWEAGGRDSMDVSAVVVPAIGRPLPDPLFVLPGGPGQGASPYGRLVTTAFAEVRKHRDIVLIDPRGTGMSTPFPCVLWGGMDRIPTSEERARAGAECAASAPVDPRYLTAADVVSDVEAFRVALGYERINLWGGSFGTRLAQYYARAHPSAVRAAVFDAAVPVGVPLIRSALTDAPAALEELFLRCARDAACAKRFPGGRAEAERVVRSFARPRGVPTLDPRTGELVNRIFDRAAVAEIVRGALYRPDHAVQLPLALERLGSGDAIPAAALQMETAGWSTSTMEMGAMLAIMCSEEAPVAAAGGHSLELPASIFADDYTRVFLDACRDWPTRRLPDGFLDPLDGNPVPALVLSGEMDPVCPPSRGAELLRGFVQGTHLVARNGGHTVSGLGCAPRLIGAFLDAPGAPLDGACLDDVAWPPFALSALGPVTLP
ncbi:MAG: hypothetical protein AMXMBFR53_35400 [Gemmatimonadota bacterium]